MTDMIRCIWHKWFRLNYFGDNNVGDNDIGDNDIGDNVDNINILVTKVAVF